VYSYVIGRDISEASLCPCYFFYGEETYLADEFVGQVKAVLGSTDPQHFHLDHFYLDETRWMDIIDQAKIVSFLFSPWRVFVVRIPEKKGDGEKAGGKEKKLLTAVEEKVIKGYLSGPSSRTVIVVVLPGNIKKGHSLVKFFSGFPAATVCVKEVRPRKAAEIRDWMEKKAQSLGKGLTEEAKSRLCEVVGSDLRLMANELEKLAVYADDRKVISGEDVDQVSAWLRTFEEWDIDNALESGDSGRCLIVLDKLFKAGEKPERILFRIVGFFRNILLAKTWLRERSRQRGEIFKELFPRIPDSVFSQKFERFFSLVERLREEDLRRIMKDLEQADRRIKGTDIPAQVVFEGFFLGYGRMREKRGFTATAPRWPFPPGG
jgi:DNA polymerase III delta subunit